MTGTADFGVVTERAELADPDPLVAARNAHRLAFDLVVDRVLQFIGGVPCVAGRRGRRTRLRGGHW